jgi:hypothetical protein
MDICRYYNNIILYPHTHACTIAIVNAQTKIYPESEQLAIGVIIPFDRIYNS